MQWKWMVLSAMLATAGCAQKEEAARPAPEAAKPAAEKPAARQEKVKLITLDPGHFHAALVQKFMYPQVDPVVRVYAPEGPDVQAHLQRIEGYNTRAENPTAWKEEVYTGPDFFETMIEETPGNVVVLAGNNAQKTAYVLACVEAGLNVLSDKPMAIDPAGFALLREAFETAGRRGVLLYDIMTERHEITSILQKELAHRPEVFGTLQKGTPEEPAVTKESVHHFFKYVSGKPLIRPGWYFDVTQQGEGLVDVTTHLVDLIQWACFPEVALDWQKDVTMLSAKRWATKLTPEQFTQVTKLEAYPEFLKKDVDGDGALNVFANGEMVYTLKGVHAKVSVVWNFEAPEGTQDTHFSIMRGTRANLVIRQGKEQGYKPMLYVENTSGDAPETFEKALRDALAALQSKYPGVGVERDGDAWRLTVPESYQVGHEAHFAQVTEKYLKYLAEGRLPAWEVPNMLTKYYTTTQAYKMSR